MNSISLLRTFHTPQNARRTIDSGLHAWCAMCAALSSAEVASTATGGSPFRSPCPLSSFHFPMSRQAKSAAYTRKRDVKGVERCLYDLPCRSMILMAVRSNRLTGYNTDRCSAFCGDGCFRAQFVCRCSGPLNNRSHAPVRS